MPIDNYFDKSVNTPVVLFQIDLLKLNIQWINIGSGIWEVNFDNIYSFVDSTLLDGFTIQTFDDIASVLVDSTYYSPLPSLLLVSETLESFIYDSSSKTLYAHFTNNDDPILHQINLGLAQGYSYDTIMPIDSTQTYEGRITNISNFNKSRDPLFFGRLEYQSGSITLLNGDGSLDTFANDNNLYGNQSRILLGYPELSIMDYKTIFTGIIDKVTISEENAVFNLKDKRAQLTKEITFTRTNINALDAIVELLSSNYGYNYTEAYYDIAAWEAAKLLAPTITVNYTDNTKVIEIIEEICNSIFGFFDITPEGLFTFRFVDNENAGEYLIPKEDILNSISIEYNPDEVISAIEIGYNKDWDTNEYIYYLNDTREAIIFNKYKTYITKTLDTLLISLESSQALSETILDYLEDVQGLTTIQLPIKYYNNVIGKMINVELNRANSNMLGIRRCEIIGIDLNLNTFALAFKLRIYQEIELNYRIVTTGETRLTSSGLYYRLVEE